MNVAWSIYGICEEKLDTTDNCYADNPTWGEWDSLKFSWNDWNGSRDHAMNIVDLYPINGFNGAKGQMATGYVWSWINDEQWPDATPSHQYQGSFHFDQIPRFINSVYRFYLWTGNDTFLKNIFPKVQAVMDYLLNEMNATNGVPINRFNEGYGVKSRPSTYMDQIKSGWKDAWIAATFYTCLRNYLQMNIHLGYLDEIELYQALSDQHSEHFDRTFWNEQQGRYVGWVDSLGNAHDNGYVYINLEALTRGLGDEDKAKRIFDWLSLPAAPVLNPPHNGSRNVYQNVVAPRSTTENVDQSDWDGWSDPSEGRRPYGALVESGGTMLWMNYYDVMARLRFNLTDDAWNLFIQMLQRIDNDSHCLTFNYEKGRIFDDFQEDFVQLGTNQPFPESGIALVSVIDGFLGLSPQWNGLQICPKIPSSLDFLQAQVIYHDHPLTIRVTTIVSINQYQIDIDEESFSVRIPRGNCHLLTLDYLKQPSARQIQEK